MKYYKFLTADGSATHGVGKWNLPTASGPDEWMPDIVGDIVPCENGYHACRPQDVVLDQLALAPSILTRMGVAVPASMQAPAFFTA